MKEYRQKLDQAYAYLKAKRPSIGLNAGDAAKVMTAEEALFGAEASRFVVPVGKQVAGSMGGGMDATTIDGIPTTTTIQEQPSMLSHRPPETNGHGGQ